MSHCFHSILSDKAIFFCWHFRPWLNRFTSNQFVMTQSRQWWIIRQLTGLLRQLLRQVPAQTKRLMLHGPSLLQILCTPDVHVAPWRLWIPEMFWWCFGSENNKENTNDECFSLYRHLCLSKLRPWPQALRNNPHSSVTLEPRWASQATQEGSKTWGIVFMLFVLLQQPLWLKPVGFIAAVFEQFKRKILFHYSLSVNEI